MTTRPAIFKWRQTEPQLILCAVRWYLRYSFSLRDVEELLEERCLEADHTTVWRWVQRVRWYCRFSLSLRDLEELMAERGLGVEHTNIWRWVQRWTGGPPAATGECEAKIFHLAHG